MTPVSESRMTLTVISPELRPVSETGKEKLSIHVTLLKIVFTCVIKILRLQYFRENQQFIILLFAIRHSNYLLFYPNLLNSSETVKVCQDTLFSSSLAAALITDPLVTLLRIFTAAL